MKAHFNIRRNYSRLAIWSAIVFAAWFGLFSGYGALTRYQLEAECTDIREQIAHQQHITDSLRRYANKILFDTLEIERIARERYGMIKPGETIYIIRAEN